MKKIKKLSCLLLLSGAMLLAACGGKDSNSNETTIGTDVNVKTESYTVSIKSIGGMALSGIDVYVYEGEELKTYGSTDASGLATFTLPESSNYSVKLAKVAKGYAVNESYPITGTTAIITLESSLIKDDFAGTPALKPGDVMYDITVTATNGEKVTLSELLATKKMVMLNFWYVACQWCQDEFPVMNEVYEQYKDDIAIVALNPMDEEAAIKAFAQQAGYSFYMAPCSISWNPGAFMVYKEDGALANASGYPTSVFIDRYGVICLVEEGAITSPRPFISAFEHFTSDDYEQKICTNIGTLVTQLKPTYTMDSSENIAAIINKGSINATFRPETGEGSEYAWPFIAGKKLGRDCIYASNVGIEGSYSIIYADVELKKGQALGFDYLASTEKGADNLYVIVNGDDVYQISGVDDNEKWKSCYPVVATEDGVYELALCYLKDDDTNEGDDTVYISNLRVVSVNDIDTETYLPREAANSTDGFEFNYVKIVYNPTDGYYHVGSANGPLLLATLIGPTQFNEEQTVLDMTYDGQVVINGKNIYDELVEYCTYASNSKLNGVCTVNEELAELLKALAKEVGFNQDDENEWLKFCMYFEAYGSNGKQFEDPIAGLATFSAFDATFGKNINTNFFYYDRPIIPRGMFAEFKPTKSGVYRITSKSDSTNGIDGWIFDENGKQILTYEHDERLYEDMKNCSMVFYMEAGKSYYINFAFWDMYEVGYIYYDIEYIANVYELFRLASPGYFTYDSDATGNEMYYVISGGIAPILKDGIYYENLGKDANGKQLYGSKIYADFYGTTGIFDTSIENLIKKGAFDFSKDENDMYILAYLAQNNNDKEKTRAALKELWGEDFDAYAAEYLLDDVLAGKYHGNGPDLTEEIKTYLKDVDKSGKAELEGCVVVTERLAQILQLLMDKYTFKNVDNSWLKLCYYYDYLGPAK